MHVTMGGIAGLLIGFACGGGIFLIVGILIADRFWRKKMLKTLDGEKHIPIPDAHVMQPISAEWGPLNTVNDGNSDEQIDSESVQEELKND